MRKILTPVFFLIIFFLFICFDIYVSNVRNTAISDAYLLSYVDDIFHYCYAKISIFNPLAILNPYAKPLPTLIQSFILRVVSPKIVYLRFLSSFFSMMTLFFLYLYCKRLDFKKSLLFLVLFITLTSPLYFLSSLSSVVEPLFCFLLMLSVFLLREKLFFWFSLIIGLLPITHQIGIIYALGASLFFLIKKRYNLASIVLMPALIWTAMNSLILKHPLGYTFFYPKWITACHRPPDNSLLSIYLVNPFFIMACVPFALLFLVGYIDSVRKKKYPMINLFILPVLVLVLGYNCFLVITEKNIWREFRYFVPIIPFASVIVVNGISCVNNSILNLKYKKYFIVFSIIILLVCSLVSFFYLQKDVKVIADRVTPSQEDKILETSKWLNAYMEKNQIKELYLLNGGDITNKYVRRIWMHLNADKKFYCLTKDFNNNDKIELFDMVTYKFSPAGRKTGIFLHMNKDLKDAFLLDNIKLQMVREVPEISLYFFVALN